MVSSRYVAAHVVPQGPGDSRPTALQVVQDEGAQGILANKVFVIAGATSGIGLETARALSSTGATMFLTVRKVDDATKEKLAGILEPGRVYAVEMDLDSFASVRHGAEEILSATKNINVLINSAGVLGIPTRTLTKDDIEKHFPSNYLGFFLLFQLLKKRLLASATPGCLSRVVMVSSSAHRAVTLPASDNYNFEKGGYNWDTAYGNAKLAAVYFANTIDRLYGSRGLHATSLHPGAIHTGISRHLSKEFVETTFKEPSFLKILKSPEQGAATTVWAAVGKQWEGVGGRYLEDCQEAQRGADDGQAFGTGWVKQTYDVEEEDRLWKDSLKIVGWTDE